VSKVVELSRDGDIGIVTIDSPPVNALSHAVRSGIQEAFTQAKDDQGIKAIVLACKGRTFVAGADITEFGKPPQPPGLRDNIELIENLPKPVVAAIHGTALGGGLELALACHFRVAVPDARLGLPEVKLGILPGAGGTQRLPRAIGPEKALRMIVSGDPIPARQALADGLIDEIVEGDLVASAVAFTRKAVAEQRPLRRLRDEDAKLAATRADRSKFEEAGGALTSRARGLRAPVACVEAVKAALDLPFDQGLQRERELFQELVTGDQSKAQRYIFFAEREAAKVPGVTAADKPRDV